MTGLTVDHSLVLAGGGIGREWAYVALSRGRQTNRLYVAEREDDARAEFAPIEQQLSGAIERLTRSLRSSDAQVLAIDSGRPVDREPEDELVAATRARRELERQGRTWMPGRRRRLETARQREDDAAEKVAQRNRVAAEMGHGARPFVSEQDRDAEAKRRHQAIAERATQRVQGTRHEREL